MSELAPDYTEPIIGWRAWRVMTLVSTGARLVSLHQGTDRSWPVGEPHVAGCLLRRGHYEWRQADHPAAVADPATWLHEQLEARYGDHPHAVDAMRRWVASNVPPPPPPKDGVRWEIAFVADSTHPAPSSHCGCGIYAMAEKELAMGAYPVYGTVRLWGRVIRHERGCRAEFAYPDHLYVEDENLAEKLREAYGVEVDVLAPRWPSREYAAAEAPPMPAWFPFVFWSAVVSGLAFALVQFVLS